MSHKAAKFSAANEPGVLKTQLAFVPFDRRFLELSWSFFSDAEIRRLTKTPEFSRDEQECWFEHLPDRDDYLAWGVTLDTRPIGATGLKKVTPKDGEYWGYIADRQYWGQGLGGQMLQFILFQARARGLLEVYLHVQCDNPRAINLYRRTGFKTVDEHDGTILMRLTLIASPEA